MSSRRKRTKQPSFSKKNSPPIPKEKRELLLEMKQANYGIVFYDGKFRLFGFKDVDNLRYFLQRNVYMDWDNKIYNRIMRQIEQGQANEQDDLDELLEDGDQEAEGEDSSEEVDASGEDSFENDGSGEYENDSLEDEEEDVSKMAEKIKRLETELAKHKQKGRK